MRKIILLILLFPLIMRGQQPACGSYSSGTYQYINNNTSPSNPLTNSCSISYSSDAKAIYAADYIKLQSGFHAGPFTSTGLFRTSSPMSYSVQKQDVGCYGGSNGSATITVTGGTPSYTYAWSCGGSTNTISNKPSGTYYCTITDAINLSIIATAYIGQPQNITYGYENVVYSCNSGLPGTVRLNISGGTQPYSCSDPYYSNGEYTRLPGGPYTLTITDAHNCQSTASMYITNYKINTVTLTKHDDYYYKISNIKTDDNTNFALTYNQQLSSYVFQSSTNSWDRRTQFDVEEIDYNNSYIAYPGNVFAGWDVINDQINSIQRIKVGDDPSNCSTDWNQIIIVQSKLGSTDNQNINETFASFSDIYPNPNDGNFSIKYSIPKELLGILNLYNMQGQVLKTVQLTGGNNIISFNEQALSDGLYYYTVLVGEIQISTGKIVVIR